MNPAWPVPSNHPSLENGEPHVWAVHIDAFGLEQDSFRAILSDDEQRRSASFRRHAPRERYIAARAALRTLLGRYLNLDPADVAITLSANNKPRLGAQHESNDLRFNVAHSDRLALIALACGREIGVDVERLRRVHHAEQIARRYFHPLELAAIATAPAADRDAAFLRCWTGKEAVLKALGTGITGTLAAFYIPANTSAHGAIVHVPTKAPDEWTSAWVCPLDVGDEYLAAVAVLGEPCSVRCMSFEG
jgi:4'-phosphopantetheinyl transferase